MTPLRVSARLAWGAALAALVATGCPRRASKHESAASASAAALPAPVASGFPAPGVVSSIVNPDGVKAYAGPAGSVRGRVVATGDAPPEQPEVLAQIPEQCGKGREAYGKLFREGPNRALADVLVAVTGYKGYVPETEPTVDVKAEGCFWGTRTFVLTFGQRIDIVSGDREAYIPELIGERGQPQLIATPGGGAASHLYPTRPGGYQVVDNLKLFMTAEVLVLRYSTHAVTGLDGTFEIRGIPAGPVTVSALLPQTQVSVERKITVVADKPSEELVLEIPFDRAAYEKARALADAGAPSAAAPSAASSAGARAAAAPSASLRSPQKSAPRTESQPK
ncbi:MAG TPA: hypothetical protein VGK73_23395 [Polyangiaceae bacterium]